MKNKKEYRRSREIIGVVLLAVALFLLLCFVSYDSNDPSLTHYVAEKIEIKNMGGFVGAYLADSFIQLFGISTYLFPLALFFLSLKCLLNKNAKVSVIPFAGFLGLLFSSSALIKTQYDSVKFFGVSIDSGGILGTYVSGLLHAYLNHLGTYIVLVVILLVSIILTIDMSLVALVSRCVKVSVAGFQRIRTFIQIRIERLKRRKQSPRLKKDRNDKTVPRIIDEQPDKEKSLKKKSFEQVSFDFFHATNSSSYSFPPLSLLNKSENKNAKIKKESLIMNARLLEKKLADFGIEGKVVEVKPGPVITMYELEPAPGVKINKITNLADDLALTLKAQSMRIIAPIPGKSVIGVEIPNQERESVYLWDVLDCDEFSETRYLLPIALGKDIIGNSVITDLTKMPHLLIAGTTGSGKSVSLNAMICSILYKALPEDVKFLMIDPKRLELSGYEGIPHLLHPVVVNPKKASQVLKWAVEEMNRRYCLISEAGAKNIGSYNKLMEKRREREMNKKKTEENVPEEKRADEIKLPYIVIVIDELADLMMVAQRNVEESLARLAQMARAAGIHLILATQRPSVDVITGIIKANFPTRISFQVSSKVDSRTILDQLGAEKLLGAGDMLFIPPGKSALTRIHGAFVSDEEIEKIVGFVKSQGTPLYDESISEFNSASYQAQEGEEEYDEKYDEAIALVTDLEQASISLVQRYLKIGYNRAARIIEKMEAEGVVGPADGSKPRKVLARKLSE